MDTARPNDSPIGNRPQPMPYIDLTGPEETCCSSMVDTSVVIFKVIRGIDVKLASPYETGFHLLEVGMRLTCGFKESGKRSVCAFQEGTDIPTFIFGDDDKSKIARLLLSGDHVVYIDITRVDPQVIPENGDLLSKGIGRLSIICEDDLDSVDVLSPTYTPVAGRSDSTPKKGPLSSVNTATSREYENILSTPTPTRQSAAVKPFTGQLLFGPNGDKNVNSVNVNVTPARLGGLGVASPSSYSPVSFGQRLFGQKATSVPIGSSPMAMRPSTPSRPTPPPIRPEVIKHLELYNHVPSTPTEDAPAEMPAQLTTPVRRQPNQRAQATKARLEMVKELKDVIYSGRRDMYYALTRDSALSVLAQDSFGNPPHQTTGLMGPKETASSLNKEWNADKGKMIIDALNDVVGGAENESPAARSDNKRRSAYSGWYTDEEDAPAPKKAKTVSVEKVKAEVRDEALSSVPARSGNTDAYADHDAIKIFKEDKDQFEL